MYVPRYLSATFLPTLSISQENVGRRIKGGFWMGSGGERTEKRKRKRKNVGRVTALQAVDGSGWVAVTRRFFCE